MNNTTDFVIVKQPQQGTENVSGRGSSVRTRVASDMHFVEKSINPNGIYARNHEKWFDTSVRAKKISDEIRQKNNPAYSVPKTFISHGKVKEEAVDGVMLGQVPKDWLAKNRDWIEMAVAQFINDMSELRHVQQYVAPNESLCFLEHKNVQEFRKFLDSRGKDLVADDDKILMVEIYEFLRDLPENQELVFGHNDLHQKNIMIDMKNKKLYVIDFELAGWRSKLWGLYCQVGSSKIWDMVNKLPRAKNPNLKWNYNLDVMNLVRFLRWVQAEMQYGADRAWLKRKIHDNCEVARKFLVLAATDAKNDNTTVNKPVLVSQNLGQRD